MYNSKIKLELTYDYSVNSFDINLDDSNIINIHGLEFIIDFHGDLFNISLTNNLNKIIKLNKLILNFMKISPHEYTTCVINEEFPCIEADTIKLLEIKNKKIPVSFLYTILSSEKDSKYKLIGFLSSHISRNYIEINPDKDNLNINLVYDFINHKLEPNETIKLDSVYYNDSQNYSKLISKYSSRISTQFALNNSSLQLNTTDCFAENKLLFTKEAINETVHKENKAVCTHLNKSNAYLIDISSIEGKKLILEKCNFMMKNSSSNIIKIENIKEYVKKIIELNCFNPYHELNNLFKFIKESTKDIYFMFSDCPLGLAINNLDIINNYVNLNNSSSLLNRFFKKEDTSTLHYNLIIKTLLQNSIFKHNTSFNVNNTDIKELLEIINMNNNLNTITNKSLLAALYDFNPKDKLVFNQKNKNVFSFFRLGKKAIYIAIFNLSTSSTKFFLDLSPYVNYNIKNGTATDILNDTDYLISSNKIYIKNIQPMQCILIKKDLSQEEILKLAQ